MLDGTFRVSNKLKHLILCWCEEAGTTALLPTRQYHRGGWRVLVILVTLDDIKYFPRDSWLTCNERFSSKNGIF